jgi:hypothetical protein
MKYHRINDEPKIFKTTLNHYTQQHLRPLINASAYLSTRTISTWQYPLEDLLFSIFQKISRNYPEQTYQQLQHTIERDQLPPAEHQHLKNGLHAMNQQLVADNEKLNQDKKIWYRGDLKAYLKHPFKRKKPDRSRYKALIFTESDSPFNLKHAYNVLSNIFQALEKEQQWIAFQSNHHLEADKVLERQDQAIIQKTNELADQRHAIKEQGDLILVKQALLERELVQLKHLTKIAEGYTLLENQEGLTSPEEQIEALDALLEKKRKG